MARALRTTLGLLTLVASVAAATPLQAAGRLIGPFGSAPAAERVELALSAGTTRHTVWLSATLTPSGPRFAWVLPVTPGTRVDAAGNAFLEALDDATATRIAPPVGTPSCGNSGPPATQSTAAESDVARIFPTHVSQVSNLTELQAEVAAVGLALTQQDVQRLAPHADGSFLLLTYESSGKRVRTDALRLTVPGSAPPLATGLLAGSSTTELVSHVLSDERARLQGEELSAADLSPTWLGKSGRSDYLELRGQWLAAGPGGRFVVEASGASALFQWTLLPGQAAAIAPAVHGYFTRTFLLGQSPAADACLMNVWAAREAGKLGAVVSRYCPPATLGTVPGAELECDANAGAGQTAASELVCGQADDVAAALAEHNAASLRVTRHVSALAAAAPASVAIESGGKAGVGVVVTASGVELEGCTTGAGGGGPGVGSGGSHGGSGWPLPGPEEPVPPPVYEQQPSTDVGIYCGGSSESSGTCSGDSSSSSGDGACSGDSSSSSSDSDCGGDSSSSSSDGACSGDSGGSGEACSGDSSSSSGSGCSGDSGGSSGCSGGSGSGGDCRIGRQRPRAPVLVLGLALLGFVLRRRHRRPRR
ncbi:MAG: hypothetical protein KF718_28695 [Polyangiaceae bacterium]|nr:hypothetical protein [Polyangiaceae bacterium]